MTNFSTKQKAQFINNLMASLMPRQSGIHHIDLACGLKHLLDNKTLRPATIEYLAGTNQLGQQAYDYAISTAYKVISYITKQ